MENNTTLPATNEYIEVFGAREHNLKNVDVNIPRNKLVVITGISGSGKSSLAFQTIFAEGQRRYLESFSAYARSFIGNMERPDVDKINGLSPVISIEQKTTSRNPRSTVGTLTEIYDFFRLLYARAADAYSPATGEKMVKQSEDQIIDTLLDKFNQQKIDILAPLVKGRKGHYRELFVEYAKKGYTKMRVDGEIAEITPKMQLDRYKIHDIELVVDRIEIAPDIRPRLTKSVQLCLKLGGGSIMALDANGKSYNFSKTLTCPTTGESYPDPAPNLFSFNSPYGYCPTCKGLGNIEVIDPETIIPDTSKSISAGGIAPLGEYRDVWIFKKLQLVLKKHKATLSTPINKLTPEALNEILHGSNDTIIVTTDKNPWGSLTSWEGVITSIKRYRDSGEDGMANYVEDYIKHETCPDCKGARLRKEALSFKFDEKNISQVAQMDITDLQKWVEQLPQKLDNRQTTIAREPLKEILKRIGFLVDIGLGYLTLDRPQRTLSGGEAQRIRLATQIGAQLTGVLYIMDEPSIGLHQRDNVKLIQSLKDLRDIGNTVLIVEHDKDIMLESDYLIDIGPGAGIHGGRIVAQGTPSQFLISPSATADYLSGRKEISFSKERKKIGDKWITLSGANGHNLKNVDLKLPLGLLVCITGVSGSGKSTLIHETLYPLINKYVYNAKKDPLPYESITGLEFIDKVVEVDQSPIGRTPRSSPATYTGVFTDIRQLFAQLNESKIRGYSPGRFSFNVKGGRCETCGGGGMRVIEMDFLPDVHVPCETCKGRRYNRETLEVRFKGKSISDVLQMTVEQAVEFFANQPNILRKIKTLQEVGLGYVTLGQHATTLSGGEAQRVKLATELSKKDTGKTIYILDEPTTGLHFQDIEHLMVILNKLTQKGNTVVVIEHNLDVIKCADYIIDIGPEGGKAGGLIVAQGTPEEVSMVAQSYTGYFLNKEFVKI